MTVRQEIISDAVWRILDRGARRRVWISLGGFAMARAVRRQTGLHVEPKDVQAALTRLAGQGRLRRRGLWSVWLR